VFGDRFATPKQTCHAFATVKVFCPVQMTAPVV